jgi:hypothetical protein
LGHILSIYEATMYELHRHHIRMVSNVHDECEVSIYLLVHTMNKYMHTYMQEVITCGEYNADENECRHEMSEATTNPCSRLGKYTICKWCIM